MITKIIKNVLKFTSILQIQLHLTVQFYSQGRSWSMSLSWKKSFKPSMFLKFRKMIAKLKGFLVHFLSICLIFTKASLVLKYYGFSPGSAVHKNDIIKSVQSAFRYENKSRILALALIGSIKSKTWTFCPTMALFDVSPNYSKYSTWSNINKSFNKSNFLRL